VDGVERPEDLRLEEAGRIEDPIVDRDEIQPMFAGSEAGRD
jgi:hypothetical protein